VQGNTVLVNIADNPVIASGRLSGALPTTLAISGVDDTFTAKVDAVEIAEFEHLSWSTGGTGLWLDVADAFAEDELPIMRTIAIELQGADALAAQTSMPTMVAPELKHEELFIRDIAALAAIVDVSDNLNCDPYRTHYEHLLRHQQNLIRFFDNAPLANSIAPIIEEGIVINNRCRNVPQGGVLDLNANISDLLELDAALQAFLQANASDEP
jgi:hypothetical protein